MAETVYYCVVRIRDGQIVYRGRFESRAADALTPGTCYGIGLTATAAELRAMDQAAEFQKVYRKQGA